MEGAREGTAARHAGRGQNWAQGVLGYNLHAKGSQITLSHVSTVSFRAQQSPSLFHARCRAPSLHSLGQEFGNAGACAVGQLIFGRLLVVYLFSVYDVVKLHFGGQLKGKNGCFHNF
jgi:hypothetical protein